MERKSHQPQLDLTIRHRQNGELSDQVATSTAENREAGVKTPSPVTDVNEPQETSASVDRHEMEPFTAASTARPPASLPVARSDYPTAAWGSLAVLVQDVSRSVVVSAVLALLALLVAGAAYYQDRDNIAAGDKWQAEVLGEMKASNKRGLSLETENRLLRNRVERLSTIVTALENKASANSQERGNTVADQKKR